MQDAEHTDVIGCDPIKKQIGGLRHAPFATPADRERPRLGQLRKERARGDDAFDQFDAQCRIAGLMMAHDRVEIRQGEVRPSKVRHSGRRTAPQFGYPFLHLRLRPEFAAIDLPLGFV